ncbi:type I glyceraldehyde-3-phosphate dehydrogenase [Robertkochia solimangrovi]|uniref:type I glyceraldehyde-3-phosphate dehydrogenase n=1 Tax=Robertkochia solimangrovi TaxID=2213046 RepID=UPI001180C91A|nr:type I glyceraldehyde-3-phosphate dehydrogenase [Robertkochia solimangrovi]TRZ41436.1 type I glyceraldehyde-3-phosphate dehydrogenase [Robertkochia solimangrovi]
MKRTRVAINGFGRIGRTLFRILQSHTDIEIVAINDLADGQTLSHLLKYDSIHGRLDRPCSYSDDHLIVGDQKIALYHAKAPGDIPWQAHDIDFVIESTGKFKSQKELQGHLDQGAKKVILSVPPSDDNIKMVVMGVNQDILSAADLIISNASCTTNNAAPMISILDELCGIEQAYITTVHSYTTDQSLHDQPHRDLRRARAAGQSIVPTTTGAAKALTTIFPELSSVIGGCGIRVPVPDGSLTDITCNVKKEVTIEQVNEAFQNAAAGKFKGILEYTEDPIVSVDIIDSPASCTFDAQMTSVIGKMVKIIGWYDNEYGYSSRLVDLIKYVRDI